MRIKEFSIMRYGPLSNTGRILLYSFNLFWGKNEDGKTLTIDALVKMLLGRNVKEFEHIDRVGENPEGYVIVEDEKEGEIKLPEKADLTKIAGLTSSECCNIFIVRNSNLSIARDATQESEFYINVTDRLTGLRTREIDRIKKALREMGKITPQGAFRDIRDEKLKTRIEDAQNLIEKIKSLCKETEEKRFDELEKESAELKEEIEKTYQEIRALEDARKREKYEKGREALDNFKSSVEQLKNLGVYNEEDERLWGDCNRDIKNLVEEREKTSEELEESKEEFKIINEKLDEIECDFRVLSERKKKLDEEIKPELKAYGNKSVQLAQQQEKGKFFTLLGIISAVLLGISLLGVMFHSSPLFYALAILFFILALVSGGFQLRLAREKAQLIEMLEKNRLSLSKLGMDAETIEKMLLNIQEFDEGYHRKFEDLQDTRRAKENLEEKIENLQNKKIPEIESKIKNLEKKIEEIKRKSKEESLEGYTNKLRLKQKLERSLGEQRSILKSHLGERGKSLEENISYWSEEIEKLEIYKDKAQNIKYSDTAAADLGNKKTELEEKLKGINEIMKAIRKNLDDIERKANEILREEEYLHCKTLVDLEAVKDKLQKFVYECENNRSNALEAIRIFEEIEAEEKEKVSELFGKGSSTSKYFEEITNGLYEEAVFNREEEKIQVRRKDNMMLEAEKLSGGAYDQLYFSIRLALGEKLLEDKKGFFIMDDPFIKADPDRLQRQVETLKKFAKLGWQVIYFSAKGEIKEALKEDIDRGNINYVELPGIFS
ncbi:MAG: repair protein SbcC/Rad50 [Candidatus Atribacteria bacterium]|nr:repair protein SbcC/Rad50 [Candidatus Atribacteria bacterium]